MSDVTDAILKIRDLRTWYMTRKPVKAVNGVDLEVGKKETIGLIGETGCGKSTLAFSIIRTLPKIAKIVDGEVEFMGNDLVTMREEKIRRIRGKDISMIFQDPSSYLNPLMKVKDQIAEVMVYHDGITTKEAYEKVHKLLLRVRIPSPETVSDYYPHQLSGGMKQRVIIATAIACNPKILIADEPTTSLDVTTQAAIMNLLRELVTELETSLIYVTHDLAVVCELCQSVCVMYAGKIVEYADIYSLFRKSHPYTQKLLNSTLSINKFKRTFDFISGDPPDMTTTPPGCSFEPRCSHAMSVCREQAPPLVEIEPSHKISCWLFAG